MKGKGGHGRGTSGKRGLGSGKGSHMTSTSKPAKASGFPMTKGTKGSKK